MGQKFMIVQMGNDQSDNYLQACSKQGKNFN